MENELCRDRTAMIPHHGIPCDHPGLDQDSWQFIPPDDNSLNRYTMITIREEQPGDRAAIRNLTTLAFGGACEAQIIDALRSACPGLVSLVAVENGEIIGHILASPVTVEGKKSTISGMGLGPMAVLPERQRHGIGTGLVRHGLARLREEGCLFVVVLGHPDYYPRFGFVPASLYGLTSQWEGVPDEAFMVMIIDDDCMNGVHGIVRYRDEFDVAME
jgi:putative acetyltransferase